MNFNYYLITGEQFISLTKTQRILCRTHPVHKVNMITSFVKPESLGAQAKELEAEKSYVIWVSHSLWNWVEYKLCKSVTWEKGNLTIINFRFHLQASKNFEVSFPDLGGDIPSHEISLSFSLHNSEQTRATKPILFLCSEDAHIWVAWKKNLLKK